MERKRHTRIAIAVGTGMVVAAVVFLTSRVQLPDGGPGVLAVTVPVPAFLLMVVALLVALRERSFRVGVATGMLALLASFIAVFLVVAAEGLLWMDRRGVFVLDADPPRHVVSAVDVVFDLVTTGMWLGHVIFWLPWLVLGAVLGAWIAARRNSSSISGESHA